MRVAIVGEQWFTTRPGGMNRYVAGLHEALRQLDVDTTTFVLANDGERLPPGVVRVGSPDDGALSRVKAFRRAIIEAGRFDVLDGHFAPDFLAAPRRPGSASRVIHFHGPWAEESRAEGVGLHKVWQRRIVEEATYRSTDLFICASEAFERELRDRYRVDPDRIRVVVPGIDLDQWTQGESEIERQTFGLRPNAFVAVVVRRLVHRMGHQALLDAWKTVADLHPEAILVIIGEGPLESAIRARLSSFESEIRVLGRVSDEELRRWYVAANLQIIPSRSWEGFGLTVLEAMACGLPSLVTDVGGLSRLPRELDPRLVVPKDDPHELAQRIDDAIAGRFLLPDAATCRQLAEAHGWPAVAQTHVKLYSDLIAGRT